jgi:hypothetical protein
MLRERPKVLRQRPARDLLCAEGLVLRRPLLSTGQGLHERRLPVSEGHDQVRHTRVL